MISRPTRSRGLALLVDERPAYIANCAPFASINAMFMDRDRREHHSVEVANGFLFALQSRITGKIVGSGNNTRQ